MTRAFLATALLVATLYIPAAAFTVYDPSNHAQNVLQAARALEQINNQIRSLQNQATMLQNMARQLQRLDYSSLGQITSALTRIDGLMIQADGIGFDLAGSEVAWRRTYPGSYSDVDDAAALDRQAQAQWQSARMAYQQTMRVQSGIVGSIQADAPLLADLVDRSQGAVGSLQAQQAGNQLLALSIKQQMQLQSLMAAQYRADAETQAAIAEANAMARERTRRFLGDGHAYSR
ncbi:P-type conjugative transfer protein TrbJ [Niveispirillum sp. KHB5.9]|uniref:P-type conjugative transfer protein TrbJ n=1 Tax=Niveispirillum sp. KHB5.9 TaxID=3400269 RepID=UPI003A89FCEB